MCMIFKRGDKKSLCVSLVRIVLTTSLRERTSRPSSRLKKIKVKLSLAREQKKTRRGGRRGVAHLHSRRVRRELVAHLIRVVGMRRSSVSSKAEHFLCVNKMSQKRQKKPTQKNTRQKKRHKKRGPKMPKGAHKKASSVLCPLCPGVETSMT